MISIAVNVFTNKEKEEINTEIQLFFPLYLRRPFIQFF